MQSDVMDGCNVIVTGGSSGLGSAISREVAVLGAKNVIINYANNREAALASAESVSAAGATVHLVQGDIGAPVTAVEIAKIAASLGHIDVLFNNAGITTFTESMGDLDALSSDDFLDIYRVNVVGAFQMIRAVRSLLEACPSGCGSVVNTASLAGVAGIGSSMAYASSKGALITLTLSLARALAPAIRVNAVCPGFMDTPWFGKGMTDDAVAAMRQRVKAAAPLKVISSAADIAAAAVFLGSTQASHITGETLLVDAGAHLNLTPMAMR